MYESSTIASIITIEIIGVVIILVAVIFVHHILSESLISNGSWIGAKGAGAGSARVAERRCDIGGGGGC